MKTKHIYLFLSLFTIIFFACGPETNEEKINDLIEDGNNSKNKNIYTDALEFNNAIIGLQAKIGVEILKIGECQDSEELKDLVSGSMKETSEFAVETLEDIEFSGDDKGFKDAALNLFRFYNETLCGIYLELAEIIKKSEEDNLSSSELESLGERYADLTYEISEKEKPLDLRLQKTQSDFAKANGFYVDADLNPLVEKFKEEVDGYEEYIEENY